jgi:membrane protease YdiL (CAAX protease family)
MDTGNGSSEPRPGQIKLCRACYQPISAGAKFCPSCGANQYPTMELEQRMEHAAHGWPPVRNAIIFYLIYLASVVPIIWLPEEDIASGLIVVSVVDVVIILVYWSIAKVPLRPVLAATPEAGRWSLIALAVLVPMLAVNLGYHFFLQRIFDVEAISIIEPFVNAGYPFWVILLEACVMPAVWEEVAFRGLIQVRLAEAVRQREAIILTAVLFAVIHCSAPSGIYIFFLGIVLGVIRARSNSLLPGILMHFFHNLVIVLLERYDVGI